MKSYIAVDWGSTQLRGWLVRDGKCVETMQLPLGVSRLNGQSPAEVFHRYLTPWRAAAELPVVMAGMIGSDAGWQAVPTWPARRRLMNRGVSCLPLLTACGLFPALR